MLDPQHGMLLANLHGEEDRARTRAMAPAWGAGPRGDPVYGPGSPRGQEILEACCAFGDSVLGGGGGALLTVGAMHQRNVIVAAARQARA